MKLLLSLYWPTLFILTLSLHAKAQCTQADITISTNTTWTSQDKQLTNNQKIIITNGATLTMVDCYLHRKSGCTGYWDGIYLVTAGNGAKAGLIANDGTRIEYSRNGITAENGFSVITLDDVEMSDNGRILRAMDNWPFASITGGGFTPNSGHNRDGGPTSPYEIGCDGLLTPSPPKVTIRNGSILKVLENGSLLSDPSKDPTQINILGGALDFIHSFFSNSTSLHLAAIAQSRGKCKIFSSSSLDGFYIGVYKGTDANALCSSEGLLVNGSEIKNTNMWLYHGGWAIYNLCPNMILNGNIIESSVWSLGTCYGGLLHNNIYQGDDLDVTPSIEVVGPRNSFTIKNNCFGILPAEFDKDNRKTYATCNKWIEAPYGAFAVTRNLWPESWGLKSEANGNIWDTYRSEVWNLSIDDTDFKWYYDQNNDYEIFDWHYQITEISANDPNPSCDYTWPLNFGGLDPDDLEVDMEDLENEYTEISDDIEYLIDHSDTTLSTVHEELSYLRSKLSDIIGQCLFFHTGRDEFWTEEVDPKVVELQGLNYLWFDYDMFSITEHLDGNPDPDAEALYDAANKMDLYFNNGKNLTNLTSLQLDTLELIAESSYGDYTSILRNYLYMMYGRLIPYQVHTVVDSFRNLPYIRPVSPDSPLAPPQDYTVAPNPFTDYLQIVKTSEAQSDNITLINVYSLDGTLVYSSVLSSGSGNLNLSNLGNGVYFVKVQNPSTGKIEVKRIYKE